MLPSKRFHQWTRKAGLCLLMSVTACAVSRAQDVSVYSNRKVFSGFVEYSNDSSHMLLGYADGRKINALGASFEKRSFLKDNVTGSWLAEVRPYMTVTDPTMTGFMLKFPEQPTYSGMVTFASPVPVDKPVNSTPLNVILVTQNQAVRRYRDLRWRNTVDLREWLSAPWAIRSAHFRTGTSSRS